MTTASGALGDVVERLPPVDLAEVLDVAALQTRTDRKYLLEPEEFARFGAALGDGFRALEIDGRRLFAYESVYFDTPALGLYRSHRQGRRRRYKVRTRAYLDSGDAMLEVKLEGHRGATVKRRTPHPASRRHELTGAGHRFVSDVLDDAYRLTLPQLEPVLTTTYTRGTLVDTATGARVTCDVDLVCSDPRASRSGPDRVLVESKSASGASPADDVLAEIGVRQVSLSKYCVGVALLRPHLAANRWSRVLRREFGWQRSPEADLEPTLSRSWARATGS
ncbi:conserved hypothetical protein [Beutenbergia cavernae DSM 12333]|uniref:VTC domain-containing protein n=1 Tax=Beutenbergia cavernae (strain ATCC BAA-8 / DSM 12333 / CCUG 43141 / JCM 11478 / NBRC 16432 / NCIMB 13614 / HKI 0122) TaxID=471853 RepID=C5BZE1_BEUC1|nr:polyphosphate polymerase domain-containing protein [Beutenbergia cavernae]ACQ79113.1 conserved hypothetical protein [Beutenbergia cavernae DSM 12333]